VSPRKSESRAEFLARQAAYRAAYRAAGRDWHRLWGRPLQRLQAGIGRKADQIRVLESQLAQLRGGPA